jgi:GST-like protein
VREFVGFDRFLHVQAWLGLARPAVQRGLEVTAA